MASEFEANSLDASAAQHAPTDSSDPLDPRQQGSEKPGFADSLQLATSETAREIPAWNSLLESLENSLPASEFGELGVLVGCSGGADSVALLVAVQALMLQHRQRHPQARGFVIAAHFDHGLRGEESAGDQAFVSRLAAELEIEFVAGKGPGSDQDEASLRNQRREFFLAQLQRSGARYLFLAHSMDDNVETVLDRLMRGTGPTGLRGIPSFRPFHDQADGSDFVVARPLLQVPRQTIRDALLKLQIPWREDPSNASTEYRRNWIRHQLLPLLQDQNPQVRSAVARMIDSQNDWGQVIAELAEAWLEQHVLSTSPLVLRSVDAQLANDPPSSGLQRTLDSQPVIVEALRRLWHQQGFPLQAMDQGRWRTLSALMIGQGPMALTLPGAIQVRREKDSITIVRS